MQLPDEQIEREFLQKVRQSTSLPGEPMMLSVWLTALQIVRLSRVDMASAQRMAAAASAIFAALPELLRVKKPLMELLGKR